MRAAESAVTVLRGHRGLLVLLVLGAGAGISAGLVSVAVPATALAHGARTDIGLLVGMTSAGEIVAGFACGARRWTWSQGRLLLAALGGSAVAAGLAACVADRIALLFPAMFLAGLCSGPFAVASSSLLDSLAPAGALTRSYTLLVGLGLLANSLGSSAGGVIVDAAGYRLLLVVNACWLVGILATGLLLRHLLTPRIRLRPQQ